MTQTMTRDRLGIEIAARYGIDTRTAMEAVDTYAGQLQDDDLYDTETGRLTVAGADVIRAQFAADHESVPGDGILDEIIVAEQQRAAAIAQAEEHAAERDALIRKALAAQARVVDVAEAAGLKPARIYQIRDGRR